MELEALIDALQYKDSPNFVRADELSQNIDFGFLYRRASQHCGLEGAYLLRRTDSPARGIPIVYVCNAKTEEEARTIHQRVWNQDLVPFLLVASPRALRMYRGFRFDRDEASREDLNAGALRHFEDFNRAALELESFRAEAIDSGRFWREWASEVTPDKRVDWRLLGHLHDVGKYLANSGLTDRTLINGIIGKFVYLRYLRDREILSDRKLQAWGLDAEQVLGRHLTLKAFEQLLAKLDEWLNGAVFPLTRGQLDTVGEDRLRTVAGVFRGDAASGQLALEFADYDFSFIPIETLSVIYEQFLHAPDPQTGVSKGRVEGAYYTPVPVVNYMLDRLNLRRPLLRGMRILDPSCGSGVFLVQTYRRLIEQAVRNGNGQPPRPAELRALLTEHIFGIDTDDDACHIAELSLILTLLDYVTPPDLESTPVRRFQLPTLRGENIFRQSAFAALPSSAPQSFNWVVGNPPWKEVKSYKDEPADPGLTEWIRRNSGRCPAGRRQFAEMFAWRSHELLDSEGSASLLLPAMTLFKSASKKFRVRFFAEAAVWEVANFANLVNVLFAGRSTVPAAALFFSKPARSHPSAINVYTPFLANQPTLYDAKTGAKQKEAWNIFINLGEVRPLRYTEALSGNALHWKLAAWGSYLDKQLLDRIRQNFLSIRDLEARGSLVAVGGFELHGSQGSGGYEAEYRPELVDKRKLLPRKLKERKHLWRFPKAAIGRVAENQAYVRLRGGFDLPLRVCEAPHIVVARSGAFAVYEEDEFLVIPPRQVGIGAETSSKDLLKAITLYLNSDFSRYYQFFHSPEAGIQKTIGTTGDLKATPLPFDDTSGPDLQPWVDLYQQIVDENHDRDDFSRSPLIRILNELTNDALHLTRRDRSLVGDLIHVRMDLTRGKVGRRATGVPEKDLLQGYAVALRDELDSFLGEHVACRHRVRVAAGDDAAAVEICLIENTNSVRPISVEPASPQLSVELALARANARQEFAQWFYFDRNLRIFSDALALTYVCKPMQRMQWTQTQALLDAGEIIADTLASPTEDTAARG
jgi:hypothetical protein